MVFSSPAKLENFTFGQVLLGHHEKVKTIFFYHKSQVSMVSREDSSGSLAGGKAPQGKQTEL